jgi:hypothetical protein
MPHMHFGRIALIREGSWRHAEFFAQGEAYWSSAIGAVLEKHGFVDFTEFVPSVLEAPDALSSYHVILIARLHPDSWTSKAIETIFDPRWQVLLEGPVPDAILSRMGVTLGADEEVSGSLLVKEKLLSKSVQRYGLTLNARLPTQTRAWPQPKAEGYEWSDLQPAPFFPEQTRIWQTVPWRAQNWRLDATQDDLRVIASLKNETRIWPVAVRRENVTALAFNFFSVLAWLHSGEPMERGEYRSSKAEHGLDGFFLGLIETMFHRLKLARLRVCPWSLKGGWALNIRHDFDRDMELETLDSLLAVHDKHRSRATWYWRIPHAESECLPVVAEHGQHELALHFEEAWRSTAEIPSLRERSGRQVRGCTAHGGAGPDVKFQGAPNLLWARDAGLSYCELPSRRQMHPHSFISLSPDGIVTKENILCLPRHVSLDAGPRDGAVVEEEELLRYATRYINAGGLFQVLNHPDLNRSALDSLLSVLPTAGRVDVTADSACRWWSDTHDSGNPCVFVNSDGIVRRAAHVGSVLADAIQIDILAPDEEPKTLALESLA